MAPASLSVRVFLPATGALLGLALQNCKNTGDDDDAGLCPGAGLTAGLIVGFALASAVDAALFSWDKPKVASDDAPLFGVAPVLSRDGKRAELRAFGTF